MTHVRDPRTDRCAAGVAGRAPADKGLRSASAISVVSRETVARRRIADVQKTGWSRTRDQTRGPRRQRRSARGSRGARSAHVPIRAPKAEVERPLHGAEGVVHAHLVPPAMDVEGVVDTPVGEDWILVTPPARRWTRYVRCATRSNVGSESSSRASARAHLLPDRPRLCSLGGPSTARWRRLRFICGSPFVHPSVTASTPIDCTLARACRSSHQRCPRRS